MASNKAAITVTMRTCLRCGHGWLPRIFTEPVTCPKCRSPYWNKPREKR